MVKAILFRYPKQHKCCRVGRLQQITNEGRTETTIYMPSLEFCRRSYFIFRLPFTLKSTFLVGRNIKVRLISRHINPHTRTLQRAY